MASPWQHTRLCVQTGLEDDELRISRWHSICVHNFRLSLHINSNVRIKPHEECELFTSLWTHTVPNHTSSTCRNAESSSDARLTKGVLNTATRCAGASYLQIRGHSAVFVLQVAVFGLMLVSVCRSRAARSVRVTVKRSSAVREVNATLSKPWRHNPFYPIIWLTCGNLCFNSRNMESAHFRPSTEWVSVFWAVLISALAWRDGDNAAVTSDGAYHKQ